MPSFWIVIRAGLPALTFCGCRELWSWLKGERQRSFTSTNCDGTSRLNTLIVRPYRPAWLVEAHEGWRVGETSCCSGQASVAQWEADLPNRPGDALDADTEVVDDRALVEQHRWVTARSPGATASWVVSITTPTRHLGAAAQQARFTLVAAASGCRAPAPRWPVAAPFPMTTRRSQASPTLEQLVRRPGLEEDARQQPGVPDIGAIGAIEVGHAIGDAV